MRKKRSTAFMQIDSISFNSLTRKINPHLILFIGFIALLRLYTEGTALFEDIVFKMPEGGSNLLVFLLYLTLKGVYLVSQVNDLMSIENLMIIRKSKQSYHRKLLIRIFISSLLLSVILLVAAGVNKATIGYGLWTMAIDDIVFFIFVHVGIRKNGSIVLLYVCLSFLIKSLCFYL